MGYIFLTVSLLAGAAKGYCGKKLGNFAVNIQSAVLLNLMRLSLCIVLGILMIYACGDQAYLTVHPKTLFISALSGISTAFFLVTWLIAVRKSAYMMLDIFLMLGTLVPIFLGYFAFGESISQKQRLGFVVLVGAVIIMCSYNNSIKSTLPPRAYFLLTICGIVNGLTDFSQKLFVITLPKVPVTIFNLYTYTFAAVTLAVVYVFIRKKASVEFQNGTRRKYLYIPVMSVALVINSLFKTKAAIYFDSAQLYPLMQGASLILSSLMAAVFFKEKLTVKSITGIILAYIGLLIMNVL